jgi:hypothetical protein
MKEKKKQKLFGNQIEVKCEYCVNSSDYDGASVCKLKLCLNPDGNCRRFTYDPLKRAPAHLPPLKPHDADEFKL